MIILGRVAVKSMVSTPSAAGKRSIDAVSSKQSDISSKKDKADESVNNASASLNKRPKRACSSNLSSSNIQSDTATSTNVALQETSDSSNPTVAITENPVDSSHQPCYTNTKLPDTIKFDPTPVGATKFIAWNVAGLRASLKKDMMRYIEAEDADVVCLQETKMNASLDTSMFSRKQYPHQYWSHCTTKKGYSGVMVLSKVKPLSVEYKMGHSAIDDEGRFVILEYQDFYYIGCYIMNAGADLGRLDLKREHYVKLKKFMGELQSKKPVIWSGDLNVAHTEIDLARPATNTKSAGFTPEEREDFGNLLTDLDMVDSFRLKHPTATGMYSYYSFRHNSRANNVGWRLDYFVVSKALQDDIIEADIRSEIYGASDHVPILLLLNRSLGSSVVEPITKEAKLFPLFIKK
ncbi:hypothetical protein RTP6_7837 [Batrachochytrium dendrobatidis]